MLVRGFGKLSCLAQWLVTPVGVGACKTCRRNATIPGYLCSVHRCARRDGGRKPERSSHTADPKGNTYNTSQYPMMICKNPIIMVMRGRSKEIIVFSGNVTQVWKQNHASQFAPLQPSASFLAGQLFLGWHALLSALRPPSSLTACRRFSPSASCASKLKARIGIKIPSSTIFGSPPFAIPTRTVSAISRGSSRVSRSTLKDLGVTCIWLSPFFKSSSGNRNLHGYDVIDHYTVDSRLGTNDDAKALIRAAHARGIRLIFDFVPNHLSSKHPWFLESRDPKSPKRDWFVWRDTRPAKGWTGFGKASTWHASGGAFYYGIFSTGMPDINHRNKEVRLEMAKAARHWLDLGFDGLRVDAVRYLYENLAGDGAKSDQEDRPETLAWFESFRRDVLDPYESAGYAKFMVAENWTDDRRSLLKYMGDGERPAFHMTFNFPLLRGIYEASIRPLPATFGHGTPSCPPNAWLGTFTSNHDLAANRPGTLFAKEPAKLRAQAAWLLLGPGTTRFIYYGNEIAQLEGPEGGDIKHRKPLDWKTLELQRDDPASPWRWHQQLISLRIQHQPAPRQG